MKVSELEKKRKELSQQLKTAPTLETVVQLQELNCRIDFGSTVSNYYWLAKSCSTKREMKMLYKTFVKYITALPVSFYFAPSDEKKAEKVNAACQKFTAIVTGIADRAENAEFATKEEFLSSFKMDSLSVNIGFQEYRETIIKIK